MLLGTRQQGVPVILRELVLPGGFDPMSPSFTVRNVTTELSGPRSTRDRIRQGASVPSRLQVHLTDKCQVERNPDPVFPVYCLQPPPNLNI
ncbi:unnamed protein product [Schistosoma curassoni]|uniref:Uncharacterized protein n=1 Tax=Schistosoma curassoni TaxID=6186 RepID=A0A183KLV6_9TREM|nr:unnamed protein product [Schistosoma curassoni]